MCAGSMTGEMCGDGELLHRHMPCCHSSSFIALSTRDMTLSTDPSNLCRPHILDDRRICVSERCARWPACFHCLSIFRVIHSYYVTCVHSSNGQFALQSRTAHEEQMHLRSAHAEHCQAAPRRWPSPGPATTSCACFALFMGSFLTCRVLVKRHNNTSHSLSRAPRHNRNESTHCSASGQEILHWFFVLSSKDKWSRDAGTHQLASSSCGSASCQSVQQQLSQTMSS